MKIFKLQPLLLLLAVLLLLSGCAGERAFREGKALLAQGKSEEGLAKLEDAVKASPRNLEYQTELYQNRAKEIARKLLIADRARAQADFATAESLYRDVLKIEPENERALTGIEGVRMDKRHKVLLNEAEALFKEEKWEAVQDKVKLVLLENPRQPEALALKKRLTEKLSPVRGNMVLLKESVRKPITLEFRDANLKSIFEVISRTAGLNFIFDRDVRPDLRATIFVRNTTIEEAIRLLLVTNQLDQKILNQNTILIYPAIPAKMQDYRDLVVKSFYIANADVKQTLNMIKTIVKTKDVFIDEKLNLLVMRDTPEAVAMAEKLIAAQDIGEPEVMLDVEVMEVKRSLLTELGIQYPNQLSVLSARTAAAATGTTATVATTINQPLTLATLSSIGKDQIGVSPNPAVNFREEDSDVNLLANPKIRVKNREKAKIHIGDRVPVITTTTSVNIGVSESVNYLDVGLKLDVEPTVTLSGDVSIRVGLEVSNIVNQIKSNTGTLTYQVGTRNAATVLRLHDGETQMLAGLINDEDRQTANKLPGFGDIPLLGHLFSTHHNEKTKTEIVLLITPHILHNINRPDASVLEFDSGTESSVGQAPISLRSVDEAVGAGTKQTPAGKPAGKNDAATVGNTAAAASAAPSNTPTGVAIPGVLPAAKPDAPEPAPPAVPAVPVGPTSAAAAAQPASATATQ